MSHRGFTSIGRFGLLVIAACPLIEASARAPASTPMIARSSLRALGASALSGDVSAAYDPNADEVDVAVNVRGAEPGSYVVVLSTTRCGAARSVLEEPYALPADGPAWSPTSEVLQLQDPSATAIGILDVDDEGAGQLSIALTSSIVDAKAILVREVPGTINPALGDPYGYVACGAMR